MNSPLIGLTVVGGGEEWHYSFWADSDAEERAVFKQFLDTVARYPGSVLFYYGRYERTFLAISSGVFISALHAAQAKRITAAL